MIDEHSFVIKPKDRLFEINFAEIWNYRDLLMIFIKRDIIVTYKQTIMGPLWFFIQPILTTLMFLLVFSKIAGISTNGVPPILFYLAGLTVWNYFSESLRLTCDTFVKNASLFGKVYFPRVISPISVVCSNFVKFLIQFGLFLMVYFYYFIRTNTIHPNLTILALPLYLLIVSLLALSFGLIISAMTTKYRDLTFLIQFGIQLWMYITPVIYTVSQIPVKYQWIVLINPLSALVEAFKYGFVGNGYYSQTAIMYSGIFSIILFFVSLIIFNKTEKNFMDTV